MKKLKKKALKKRIEHQQREIESIKDLDKIEFPKQKKPKKKKEKKHKFEINLIPSIPQPVPVSDDELHKHETRERIDFIRHNLDYFLLDHPVVIGNKDLNKNLNKAFDFLNKAYEKSTLML